MSGIQESVLINPVSKQAPLFLFSFHKPDGDYLSVLLSNHLRSPYRLAARNITVSENYFSTASWVQYVNAFDTQTKTDYSAMMRLMIDEGRDTGRLYGLHMPVCMLTTINRERDFPDARMVIVYNDFYPYDTAQTETLKTLRKLIAAKREDFMLISSKWLIADPLKVLQKLANLMGSEVISQETILPHTALPDKLLFDQQKKIFPPEELHFLHSHDWLFNAEDALQAKQVRLIWMSNGISNEEACLRKLNQLLTLFAAAPAVRLCCTSLDAYTRATHFAAKLDKNLIDFSVELIGEHPACVLNNIAQTTNAEYLLIDCLTTDFSYASLLQHIRQAPRMLVYPSILLQDKTKNINLHDLLSHAIPEAGLLLETSSIRNGTSFDPGIAPAYIFWDLAISLVSEKQHSCVVISAQPIDTQNSQDDFADAWKQVMAKHHQLIKFSLDQIISHLSSDKLISLQERRQLQTQVSKLQSVLSHSKEELQSFHLLTAQLQKRIQYLENNWYQRIRIKVNRIKKIFFKKRSPGSGTLKRLLAFIRFTFSKAGFGILRKILGNILKKIYLLVEKRPVQIRYLDENDHEDIFTYDDWIKSKLDTEKQLNYYRQQSENMQQQPLISIIMPVFNTPLKFLREAIESVRNQHYKHWELCIADDCSTEKKVSKMLKTYAIKDDRIKVVYRSKNGHISAASNTALELANGEFVLLFDHDDLLAPNCLTEIVLAINKHKRADIIYSDEDKITESGIHLAAHFKPDWAPDHLLSRNYMGHVVVIRRSLIHDVGGFREGFEGSQDYDLLLRTTECSQHIVHIPKVLYHWRIHEQSAAQGEEVKPYAYIAAKKALSEALERRGLRGEVKYLSGLRGYQIDYALTQAGKVSIIIPTKDQADLLKNTIDSILEKTRYKNYEIIILNNNSTTRQLNDLLMHYTNEHPETIVRVEAHFPFNFSKLMNIGVQQASGEYYLLLNNDVEVIQDDWLDIMLSYAQQTRIGAVGVRLLYPDDTIQHAGVVVGLGGIAGHTFVGMYKDEPGYFNYIQSVNNYSAVTAACMMVSKKAWEKVNGMDETFEVEYNDVDFCLKLYEAGYYNVYLPQVALYHYESATRGHPHQSKPSYERHLREMKLFKDKWQQVIDHDPFYNPNLNRGVHDFGMNFGA